VDDTAKLFAKWKHWIDNELLRDFQNLFIFKYIANGFQQSLQPWVDKETDFTDLVMWISINYIANAATAIRRLGDKGDDVISLYKLLSDIKQHVDVVTPENLATYRGNIGPWTPNGTIEETLAEDLRLIVDSEESIRKFVNKMIAHASVDAHKITPPTYGQFNDTMLTFHRIYRRCALLIAGRSCQPDEPNPDDLLGMASPDYAAQFTTMWNSVSQEPAVDHFPHDAPDSGSTVAEEPARPSQVRPDDKKKKAFQDSMLYEIVYTFGVPQHDPYDYCLWEMINFSRMGHARVLYAFLETPKEDRLGDDVLAADCGYPAKRIELANDDRKRLNKDLFHFSQKRIRHTPETKPWPDSIIGSLLEPVLAFMRYIEAEQPDIFLNDQAKHEWSTVIALLGSGRERIIRHCRDENGVDRKSYGLGEPLQDGKPRLTHWLTIGVPSIQVPALGDASLQ
jgi:hypothetical protein